MALRIIAGDLDDPRVLALLQLHADRARAETTGGSGHALDAGEFRNPNIRLFAAWEGDELMGVGALKRIGPGHGEVKAMHTAEAARGKGVGAAVLNHLLAAARAEGLSRVSLETHPGPYFAAARALYYRTGFKDCGPFAAYEAGPASLFMTLAINS